MKAILFCRVSTTRQEWDSQKTELTKAAINDGFDESDLIVNGKKESATKLDEAAREGIQEMKECIERGDVESVYVWEISRLSRRDDVLMQLKRYFIENKVQLVCLKPFFRLLDEKGDVDSMAELAFAMYSTFAQIEIRNKNARTRRGREANALLMKKTGNSVRFGYKIDSNGYYVIDEADAMIVQLIYQRYNDKKGLRTIQEELQNYGYSLAISKIRRILRFEGYTGQATLLSGIVRNYPVIIDKDTFEKAQIVKTQNNNWVDVKNKRVYISIPLIRCECGRCYASTGNNSYRCTKSREEHSTAGHSPMIKQSIIDDLVFELAFNAEKNFKKNARQEEIEKNKKAIADKEALLIPLDKKIQEVDGKLERITDAFIDGQLTKEASEKRRKNELAKLQEMNAKRVKILEEINLCKQNIGTLGVVIRAQKSIDEYVQSLMGKAREMSEKMYAMKRYSDTEYSGEQRDDIIDRIKGTIMKSVANGEPFEKAKSAIETIINGEDIRYEQAKEKYTPLEKKELAKLHIKEILMHKGCNLNTHIALIKMKSGVMYKYELNTRRKINPVVLLEETRWF